MSILEIMVTQYQDMSPSNFICLKCKNYNGTLNCQKNVFIAFEGANMSHCSFWEKGQRCPYCGRYPNE